MLCTHLLVGEQVYSDGSANDLNTRCFITLYKLFKKIFSDDVRMMVTSCMSLPMMAISTMIHRMKFGTWVQFFFFVQISIILIVVQNWWNPFSILKVLYYSSRIKLVHCFKFKFSVDSDPSTVLGNCVTQGLRDSRNRGRSLWRINVEKTTKNRKKPPKERGKDTGWRFSWQSSAKCFPVTIPRRADRR